jgi:hypothetical protein
MMYSLSLKFSESEIAVWAKKYDDDDRDALTAATAAKSRGFLQYDEFIEIAKWKSSRPMRFYQRNSHSEVVDLTSRAFTCRHNLECVVTLTNLVGVRVRTATAILHLCHPDPYPLLDFRAMNAMGIPQTTTSRWDDLDWLKIWPQYVQICRQIADRTGCDMRTIDRALWAYRDDLDK